MEKGEKKTRGRNHSLGLDKNVSDLETSFSSTAEIGLSKTRQSPSPPRTPIPSRGYPRKRSRKGITLPFLSASSKGFQRERGERGSKPARRPAPSFPRKRKGGASNTRRAFWCALSSAQALEASAGGTERRARALSAGALKHRGQKEKRSEKKRERGKSVNGHHPASKRAGIIAVGIVIARNRKRRGDQRKKKGPPRLRLSLSRPLSPSPKQQQQPKVSWGDQPPPLLKADVGKCQSSLVGPLG